MANCLSPLNIPRPNGLGPKDRVVVPCNKCVACLQRRRSHWFVRLREEYRVASSAYFFTLTYSDDKVPYAGDYQTLVKRDFQLFFKRLRKRYATAGIKYYACGEYGSITNRPHFHAIVFNLPDSIDSCYATVLSSWGLGMVHVGQCSDASIRYVTKYMINEDSDFEEVEPTFSLISKGLGKSYVDRMADWHSADLSRFYVPIEGVKYSMPRYYQEKVYSELERSRHSQSVKDALESDQLSRFDSFGVNEFLKDVFQKEAYVRSVKSKLKSNSKI